MSSQKKTTDKDHVAYEGSSADPAEIDNFDRLADDWWNPNGAMKPLHQMNPARLSFIRKQICVHKGKDYDDLNALAGLNILDVGCGAGLLCEPLARQGADITGIDAAPQAIQVARDHATKTGLSIDYQNLTAEALLKQKQRFDVITALEIIEHVKNPADFVATLCQLVKPDGLVIVSTLNRTIKSYLTAIIGAEYIARMLPVGTHQWKKFMRPSEMNNLFAENGFKIQAINGLRYHPLDHNFSLTKNNFGVNYIAAFRKQGKK